MPIAVDYGSTVPTSNQSHRLCVTLGEVKAHMQPADSPSWSQNDYGHGPSFIVVSVSSVIKTRVTNQLVHSVELCFDKWRGVRETEELFSSDICMLVEEN